MSTETFSRIDPLWTSLAGHAGAAALIAFFIWGGARVRRIDFQVIDAPVFAPSALRPITPAAPKKETVKPREVYGASRQSMSAETGMETKQGNTVAKEADRQQLRPGDADSLPVPNDEYLVSVMPQLIADYRVPYPPEARKKNIQGAVLVDLLIDGAGAVREATLVGGPGFGLNEAALEAVRHLKFKPALIEDKPVAVRLRFAYRFVLEK